MKYIIAYPPVDFSVPFPELRPEDIDIYFHYDSRIGAQTCRAACAHCYFRNQPEFHIPVDRALAITNSLRSQGYNIGMAPADSFGDEALVAGDAGSAYRLKAVNNLAWSSGAPLFIEGWRKRLDGAWDIGFRSIVINAHDAAGIDVPFAGVTRGPVIAGAIRNVQEWNEKNAPARSFSLAVTFTIRADNCNKKSMRKMVEWGVKQRLNLVRFNCFANFQHLPEHQQYELSHGQVVEFFGYLAELQEEFMQTPTALGISEDWGDAGIEQIYPYLPEVWQSRTVGWCRAGYRLFAMIEVNKRIVLAGCVDKWEPELGWLHQVGKDKYYIQWRYDQIETLRQAVLGKQVYACWGGVGYSRPAAKGFSVNSNAEKSIFQNNPLKVL